MSTTDRNDDTKPCHLLSISAELHNAIFKLVTDHHVDAAVVDLSTLEVIYHSDAFALARTYLQADEARVYKPIL